MCKKAEANKKEERIGSSREDGEEGTLIVGYGVIVARRKPDGDALWCGNGLPHGCGAAMTCLLGMKLSG